MWKSASPPRFSHSSGTSARVADSIVSAWDLTPSGVAIDSRFCVAASVQFSSL